VISPAAAELIRRAWTQVDMGLVYLQRGEYLVAETWLRPALATLTAMEALLDEPSQKPLRRMALVVMPREDADIQPWMAKKHNGSDPDAA
jgi:hypothetical protein